MPELDERVLLSFREELNKLAAVPWQALGRSVGNGMGAGAGALGALGAARGALKGWHEDRAQGGGAGEAALHALGGAAKGGLGGAAIGALGGAALSGAGALASPELAARAAGALEGGPGAIGALSRFGQRQVHGLTGWTPEGGLDAIRGGAWGQRHNVDTARAATQEAFGKVRLGDEASINHAAGKVKALKGAERARDAAVDVESRGMTSIPGSLSAIRKDPAGALAAGAKQQWHGSTAAEKALLVGLPAAQLGMAAAGHDQNKGERIGENIGGLVGGLAFGGAPLAGQLAGGIGAGLAGKMIGRGVDHLRPQHGIVNRKPELEPVNTESHVPVERNMSSAAQGLAPEDVGG